jgi:Surface antigen variable number repeat/Gram-negative bacterial TonB protein C-terminal
MGKLRQSMSRKPIFGVAVLLCLQLFTKGAPAQTGVVSGTCSGRVYSRKEVTRPARIAGSLFVPMNSEAVAHNVHGRVVIDAVLCRTGRVTDWRVIEGLPFGMTESVLGVISRLRFTAAEMNLHTVSQRQIFEFGFNEHGAEIDPENANGRLVEAVEVIGYRSITLERILSLIHAKPGEPFNFHQIEQDLGALVATGLFDKLRTTVRTEEGIRGGVVIVFEVAELPLISETRFEGLNVDSSLILDTLRKYGINLRSGATYSIEAVRDASRIIKQALESRGELNVKVNVRLESITANKVLLTFIIRND